MQKSSAVFLFIILVFSIIVIPVSANAVEMYQIKTEKLVKTDDRISIEIEYPQIELTGESQPNAEIAFNRVMKDAVTGLADQFEKDFYEFKEEGPIFNDWFLEGGYEVHYKSGKLLSVDQGFYIYGGGAHGIPDYFTLLYDVKNNKIIELKDIFREDVDYAKVISDFSKKKLLENKDMDEYDVNRGAGPDPANFEKFYITEEGMTIIFPPYQVAAYVFGPQQVKIPFSYLSPYMCPESPVAELVKGK